MVALPRPFSEQPEATFYDELSDWDRYILRQFDFIIQADAMKVPGRKRLSYTTDISEHMRPPTVAANASSDIEKPATGAVHGQMMSDPESRLVWQAVMDVGIAEEHCLNTM